MHIEDKPEMLACRVFTKKFVTARPQVVDFANYTSLDKEECCSIRRVIVLPT